MMLSVAQAQEQLMALVHTMGIENLPLAQALGRVCAQPLYAKRASPPFASAAMDGYAIRWAESAPLPATLRLIGVSQAGQRFQGTMPPGSAVRIFTGAPVPDDADTVVAQEDTSATDQLVTLQNRPGAPGAHIRPIGLDARQGALLVSAGVRLTSPRLGLLAAGLHTHVPVYRAPSVALFCLGDELALPGAALNNDQIVSTNGLLLAGSLSKTGAQVAGAERLLPDDPALIKQALLTTQADFLVTIGGASVGARDYVHSCLHDLGADIAFWKIAMRPGRPLTVAKLGDQLVFGLPGNPVSAFVCAELFLKPALRQAQGMTNPMPAEQQARWASPQSANGARADYLRAQTSWQGGYYQVHPLHPQDSAMLSILAEANALAIRPSNAPAAQKGDWTSVIPLDAGAE
jgi:molybdopterin molybdotransferase